MEHMTKLAGFLLRSLSPGQGYQVGKSSRLTDCHVGKYFAVDFNTGLPQTIDELTVGETLSPGSGVNALNPESPHIAFSFATVPVGIAHGFNHGFVSPSIEGMPSRPLTLRHGQHLFMSVARSRACLYSWQVVIPPV